MEGDGSRDLKFVVVPANAGTYNTGLRDRQRTMTWSPSNKKRHGVAMNAIALTLGVPAFAGTTSGFVSVVR